MTGARRPLLSIRNYAPPPPTLPPGKGTCPESGTGPSASPAAERSLSPSRTHSRVIGSPVPPLPAAEHTCSLAVTQRLDNPFTSTFCSLEVSCASLCPWHLSQRAPKV